MLSGGATVVAFARKQAKLDIAKQLGADHVISTKGKAVEDVRRDLKDATGQGGLTP